MRIYIDIGTTTVAAMNDKGDALSMANPLKKFGSDVVTRLGYAIEYGTSLLNETLISGINDIIEKLTAGKDEKVSFISVSANTAMSCFFTGTDPLSLASFPYTVPDHFGRSFSASGLGIKADNAEVYVSRCLSAYCGGDVLSGIIACGLDKAEENYLYVDIGTNGEMAAGTQKRVIYASAAAGPALEGGNISCGVSGVEGAVSRIKSIAAENGKIKLKTYETIGNTEKCAGLCGSALIDLLALMKEAGVLTEFGVLLMQVELPDGLTFTQDDVCALQLAKSAVRSGIECLLGAAGISADDLDDVYIAGIMGAKINIDSACAVGLFPDSFRTKARSVGNMALEGAKAMEDPLCRERAEKYARKAKKLPLSGNRRFERLFEENILL